ncbi:MAG: YfhO family protein, partial [bacterium]|nr:YfhO family protein [bacterium]
MNSITPELPDHPEIPRRLGYLGALLVFTCVLLGSNHLLVTGKAVPIWDATRFYAPAQVLVADHARVGRLLLWNPWMNGGRPDCADPQVGAFSPINVTVGLLTGGSLSGFVFYWLLMWWLGGVGVLLLAREMRAPAWGAGLGALAYATSGVFTSHAEHTTIVVAMALLPWIVWRLDVALRRGSRLAAAQAGAIWGLSALAGYPGLVIVTGFYLGLWTAGRILIAERPAT